MDTVPGYGKLSAEVQEWRRLHDIGDLPGRRDALDEAGDYQLAGS